MTTKATDRIRSQLDLVGKEAVLVRGASAPPRPPATLTVAPGVAARVTPDRRCATLYVSAEAPTGRTVRRYDGADATAAADCAATLIDDREPRAAWLCDRERIAALLGDGVVRMLERRLATAARRTGARLVVWTDSEDRAVEDRYDVVLDA